VLGSRSTKSRRSAAVSAAAVCFVATLVALPLASTAFAGTTKPSQKEFRASLDAYLQNLQGALTAASRNRQTRAVVAPRLKANVKAIAGAKSNLSKLSGTQLDAMEAILGLNPSWEEQPDVLRRNLSREFSAAPMAATATSSIVPGHGFLSNCSENFGDARGLFYSTWAAAQAAGVANAVASSLPDEVSYTPGLIVAGVAFGVANGLAIGLQDRLDRKLDCETAEFNKTLISAFPVLGTGEYTRASSQASVDRLTLAAGDIDDTLTLITGVINSTTAKLIVVINNLGLAKGNTDAIQETSIDLQARAIDLLAAIGTPTDGDPSGTAHGLANTIDARQDTALTKTASLQTLSVRLEIEETLAEAPRSSLALFALPASQGGYLETVRDIVTTTIVRELEAGQRIIGGAQEDLAAGNDALAAGKYELAYQLYTSAYRHAVG
jgi:hypothetical protein